MFEVDIPALVHRFAAEYKLKPEIVAGVIRQESDGNIFATRFERKFFFERLDARKRSELSGFVPAILPTLDTEKVHRATSWGLMQVLGETARCYCGYRNLDLTTILVPEISVRLGCQYLRRCLDRQPQLHEDARYRGALKDYNGANEYPDLIFAHIANGRHARFI